jgi:hypothetical protein
MTDITQQNTDLIIPTISKQSFISKVEYLVRNDNLTYVEAIMHLCSELDLDPEDIAKLISGPFKDKIEAEAIKNHTIKVKSNTASLFA